MVPIILSSMTLAKHGSFPSWWKYQSVRCPCLLSQSWSLLQRVPEHRGQTVPPGVSLSSAVRKHRALPPRPSPLLLLTDHLHVESLSPWMTYTQPLSGAAYVSSLQLNTCWSGGAVGHVSIPSRRRVKARVLQASGRLWSSWPGE